MARVQFIGLGKRADLNAENLRGAVGRAVKTALENKREQLTIAAPTAANLPIETPRTLAALLEGACLSNHVFDPYKQTQKRTPLKTITVLADPAAARRHRTLAARVETICRATLSARQWVSMPSNDKPPAQLARLFTQAAGKARIDAQILTETQLKRQKLNALLSVAAGSAHPACLVELRYQPAKARKTIVLVGKGVTFDTGGINLKPAQGLETMKCDMSGAAAVAAALTAVPALKPDLKIIGITPLVENMPSGSATRPGDIVTALGGKSVEIQNTDAEGRLILIDAMTYAIKKYKPDILIDVATLTGACMVGLGDKIAGLFSRDDPLANAVIAAGEAVYERCWRLPLPEDYKELLKSDLADISNMSSSRYGGAITAALFLAEFVGTTPWAHIDIAGPAYAQKGSDYCGPGGTGFGVRLLCQLIQDLDKG